MRKSIPKDVAASVRARLQNLAKQRGEDFQLVLSRFAIERLIYRLSCTKHAERFVVKGAILFHIWAESIFTHPYRATRDIDFLAHGDNQVENLVKIFVDVCNVPAPNDGLSYQASTINGERIKPDQEYEGVRIQFLVLLERARIPIQIDIGFGDAITPGPTPLKFPSMLGFPTPTIATYPRATVVAEKLQAMVQLGIANSRMKDFFDLWILSQHFEFAGDEVVKAIRATFDRRRTQVPDDIPFALTDKFFNDAIKQKQWKAFLKNMEAESVPPMSEVFGGLRQFLMPLIEAAGENKSVTTDWLPKGPWTDFVDGH